MKRIEVLNQLDSLIDNSKCLMTEDEQTWKDDIKALEIAKKAVSKEYRYKFWTSIVMVIAIAIIFGSFVAMSYFMYYR